MSLVYTFQAGRQLDSDGDGLATPSKTCIGTSPNNEDTDDDGVDDRTVNTNEQA